MRFAILGKRNRSPSIPPVFWLNLCSQLLLSFENDQIKVFEISELPEVKIRRIPHQIFKNPARGPLSPDQAWNISRAQLSTPSELGERAFQRGSTKRNKFGKKNCLIHKGIEFTISRGHSYMMEFSRALPRIKGCVTKSMDFRTPFLISQTNFQLVSVLRIAQLGSRLVQHMPYKRIWKNSISNFIFQIHFGNAPRL